MRRVPREILFRIIPFAARYRAYNDVRTPDDPEDRMIAN